MSETTMVGGGETRFPAWTEQGLQTLLWQDDSDIHQALFEVVYT
jgi:hypothetical protein